MRSVWTGAITLSVLNMPVKLGSATKDNQLGLHMIRKSDGSRIRFTRVAEKDGQEIPWSETAKGYTTPDGSLVVLDKDDFEKAYGPKSRVANVLMFTDARNIPPMASKNSYWVQPDTGGEETYALLAAALQETGKVAILTFAMRERESLAVLRPHDGYLSLESLEWDADLIRPDFTAPAQTATEAEHDLVLKLIGFRTEKFDHGAYADKSAEAVHDVIKSKIKTGQVLVPPARTGNDTHARPGDLTEALMAAVEAQKPRTPAPAKRKRATSRRTA